MDSCDDEAGQGMWSNVLLEAIEPVSEKKSDSKPMILDIGRGIIPLPKSVSSDKPSPVNRLLLFVWESSKFLMCSMAL